MYLEVAQVWAGQVLFRRTPGHCTSLLHLPVYLDPLCTTLYDIKITTYFAAVTSFILDPIYYCVRIKAYQVYVDHREAYHHIVALCCLHRTLFLFFSLGARQSLALATTMLS